ncbi:MAG: glycosyltransferase family 4 protein [Nitrospinae bacterium]|nr:glycosyltransferase family 4 protein [Nitrospinota bacterium]
MINQFFYPDQVATSQMMTDLAVDLAAKGNEVSVLTSRSAYLSNESRLARFQEYRGVKIYRTFSTKFGKGKTIGRVTDYLSFYFSVFLKAFFLKKHDVVITLSSPPLIALVGVFLKYLRGYRFFYWVQDVYPEVAVRLGFLKEQSFVTRVSKQISRFILRRVDHVVAIGESMKKLLMLKGVEENRLSVIHNWSD